ncbi:MAG TPA: DUF2330 domain-containing protein, partial [Phycisphaerales bacterium]|nr:DUF2330 domain-containing protein [Phycisphaerales bacterium]
SGAGEPLAWVVPVPAVPELFTTSDGTFATARALTQPELRLHQTGELSCVLLTMAFAALMAVAALRLNPGVSLRQRTAMCAVLVVAGFLTCAVLLLPSLAFSRSSDSTGSAAPVVIVKHQRIGTLDVTVVRTGAAEGVAPLAGWLRAAGCTIPEAAMPAIAAYAREGWVFVAACLAPGGGSHLEPTPLVMRFASRQPVYPMRLTGAGNGPLGLELCILADGMAAAPGMTAARSSPLGAAGAAPAGSAVPLLHSGMTELAALGGSPAWMTRLTSTLTPAQQRADIALHVGLAVRLRERLYTPEGAYQFGVGVDVGAIVIVIGIVALCVRVCMRQWTSRRVTIALACCAFAGCVSGFLAAQLVPRFHGDVRYGPTPERVQSRAARSMVMESVGDLSALRALIDRERTVEASSYAGLPPEGDQPWGYTLRADEKGDCWVDLYGPAGERTQSEPLYGIGSKKPE